MKNIENALTRKEMKTIMAGSGSYGCSGTCGDQYQGNCYNYFGSGLDYGCACFYRNVKVTGKC